MKNQTRINKMLTVLLLLCVLFVCMAGTAFAAENVGIAIDLSTLTETYLISDSGEYTFEGSGNYGIKVESGNPTIVLNNASITVGEGSAIDIASGSTTAIQVLGDNTIGTTKTESWNEPCGGIFVAEGGTVNIASNGTNNILRAHGTLAAAIGGKYDYDNNESYNAGNINISNVTVYAYTNNFYAAAIGAAGEGTCGTINITNAVVYAYGAGDRWTSAPGIGNAWSLLGWSDTIPIVIISDSEVHTFRYNPYSDYIGYLGDESGDTYATGSINCGDGGSVKNSTIYCYTGLAATTTDKVVKYGALGGLLKEDGTCEGEHSGGTATCTTLAVCENCGASYGERGNHSTAAEGDRAATCKELAYCSVCQKNYGEVDSTNHASTEFTYTANEDGTTHKKAHKCCDATAAETEAHTGGTATCTTPAVCDLCGESYGELGSHSFDSAGTCTGCQIKAKAKLEAFDFELDKYVPTYYATLPEALAAVTQRTSQVEALADYDGVLELTIDFDGNGYTFSGEITVDEYATIQDGNFTGKVILNYGNIWDGTFQGEVIVKADGYIQGGTFHNTVTVETGGKITDMDSTFKGTVINNGSIYAGNFYSDVTNNGKIYRDELDVSVFYGTLTNNGTIYGGYFSGGKLINAGTVENHCSDSYDYEDGFEYVPAEGGTVTGDHNNTTEANCTSGAICSFCGEYGDKNPNNHASDIYTYTDNGDGTHGKVCTECGNVVASEPHTLTYTASGNVIIATCSANCGYTATAAISAENATYDGTAKETATVTYSDGWTGGEPTVSYENNVNAGTATASITLGEATASVEFTIAKAEVNLDTLVDPEFATGLVYNGTAQALVIKTGSVEGGTILYSLTYDGEYTSTIPVATEAGRYGVYWLIQGDENHEDVLSPGWTQVIIAAKPGTDANVTLGEYDSVYSGTAKEPGIASVVVDGVTLTAGKDYDVSYENNVYAGTAKAVITFKGNYSGTATETFQISKAPLTVTADDKSMTTGRDLPAFTYTITGFVNGETEAVLTTKPTVSCEADGQTAGTYDITVSGAAADNYDFTYMNGTLSVVDHEHAWTYTADGDTITATCSNADGCLNATQTIKLIAPASLVYDGSEKAVTVEGTIDGKAPSYIARFLSSCGIPSPAGKPTWRPETVKSILTNEKYKGDAILQKTFCTDFLTKKMKVNEGEVPQYYVENSHPAIIAPDMFEAVQLEMARRKSSGRRNYTPHIFSGRIFCDECGTMYGSKVWNSNTPYRATVWQCNGKHHSHCATPSLRSETIEDAFIKAINQVLEQKEEIIRVCERVMAVRCDTEVLRREMVAQQTELEVVTELMERLILTNASVAMDQEEYNRQFAEYEARYNAIKEKRAATEVEYTRRNAKRGQIAEYLSHIRDQSLITGFNETLWYGTAEQVRVTVDGKLRFIFKGGQEVTV